MRISYNTPCSKQTCSEHLLVHWNKSRDVPLRWFRVVRCPDFSAPYYRSCRRLYDRHLKVVWHLIPDFITTYDWIHSLTPMHAVCNHLTFYVSFWTRTVTYNISSAPSPIIFCCVYENVKISIVGPTLIICISLWETSGFGHAWTTLGDFRPQTIGASIGGLGVRTSPPQKFGQGCPGGPCRDL